jgi:acetyltransferase-like isoleucine patch superfamily enzyme
MIEVGEFTYGHHAARISESGANVKIGKFCSLAIEGIEFYAGGNHRVDWITTFPFGGIHQHIFNTKNDEGNVATKGDILIGNDVWIGKHAKIFSGVTVGHGAVIGAHTIVTKDVPPYTIFAGNPGQVKRKRFSDEDIEFLLELNWWDWDVEKINENVPLLCSTDLEALKEKFKKC